MGTSANPDCTVGRGRSTSTVINLMSRASGEQPGLGMPPEDRGNNGDPREPSPVGSLLGEETEQPKSGSKKAWSEAVVMGLAFAVNAFLRLLCTPVCVDFRSNELGFVWLTL